MIDGCAEKGYEAVEYDNLDSWTRFDGTPLARKVPFGKRDALAFAKLLAKRAHARRPGGRPEEHRRRHPGGRREKVGFDFAIAEECARYGECGRYRRVHGDEVIVIEYRRKDFNRACDTVGDRDLGRATRPPGAKARVAEVPVRRLLTAGS